MNNSDRRPPAVLIEGRGTHVWTLILNRPESRNAVDEELQIALFDAVQQLAAEGQARAAVLTGSGPAFSAGGDVDLIRRMQEDTDLRRIVLERSRALFLSLAKLDVPLVCALNGPAVGAGCTLALTSDIVVMSDDAYLCEPRVSLGLVPGDGGTVLWPLLAGMSTARAYLLTGERLPAADAHRLGIVHRVVTPLELVPTARRLAESLARLPVSSVRTVKRLLDHSAPAHASLDEAMCAEEQLMDSSEHRAAIDELFGPSRNGEHD